MLFLRREDLLADHKDTLRRVYEFLGVEVPPSLPPQRIVYPTEKRASLPHIRPEIRVSLRRGYAADLEDVEQMTGLDLGAWAEVKG